jgi:hypothetical protein
MLIVRLDRAMRTNRLVVMGVSGVVVLLATWLYLRPALTSEAGIRASLLGQTPLGSRTDEVRMLAEKRGWVEPGTRLDSYMGFAAGTGRVVSALSGRIRHDPFPYRTAVSATWKFDASNRLVNISVMRHE